jgi:GTPase Era involved in 16S rRNA processing
MLDNYKERKDEVLRIYEEYLFYKEKYGDTINRETLENRAKNIRDGKFYLMVAGEAKSGKSTFINAFLGAEILPMDVKQCTSTLIKIEYGEEKTLKAFYADGHSEQKNGDEEMQKFLKEHAALKDEYRKIPVTAINNEILIKSKGHIKDYEVNGLINGVKDDNTFNLEPKEYGRLIRDYIDENKDSWQDIVTEITITYPFSEDMKDVTIIDSPGINASGMVGKVTEENIEKADAIILVKSLSGQALESKAFKSFLNSSVRERCKGALLLILTGKTGDKPEDVRTLQEQAVDMYRNSIPEKQIAAVDSKLQLFRNICKKMDEYEINDYTEKENFDPATLRWYKTKPVRSDFLDLLEKDANFNQVHDMLEDFGRKAQTKQLYDFLSLISQGYGVICGKLNEHIKMFETSDDPAKLRLEIEKKQDEIEEIKLKMNKGI